MGEKKRDGKVETAIFSDGYLSVMIIDGHDRRSDAVGKYRTATKSDLYAYTPPVRLRCARAGYIMKV